MTRSPEVPDSIYEWGASITPHGCTHDLRRALYNRMRRQMTAVLEKGWGRGWR